MPIRRVSILLLSSLLVWGAARAGRIEGRVVEASPDGPGIAFARVGLPARPIGTVAAQDGRYALEWTAELPGDAEVVFGAPGYVSERRRLDRLLESGRVLLRPVEARFEERVVVSVEGGGRSKTIGKPLPPKGFSVGFAGGRVGSQVGAHLDVGPRSLVRGAHFTVSRTGGERFLYRVNLYELRDGQVGAELLPASVVVDAPRRVGVIDVDLTPYLVVAGGDVLLAIEWIRDDPAGAGEPLMLRAERVRRSRLYHKTTSQGAFEKMTLRKLRAAFHLTVVPLDGSDSRGADPVPPGRRPGE